MSLRSRVVRLPAPLAALAVCLAFTAPARPAHALIDDEDITVLPRHKKKGGNYGPHFKDKEPEATIGIGAYAFGVAPHASRAVPTVGGGFDITTLLMVPFERDSDFAMIFAFRNMYGGFSPAGFHFDLRFSMGAAIGFGPIAAGPFVGVGLDGMGRLDLTGNNADYPRVPSALQAHYGAVGRFVLEKKAIFELTGEVDKRACATEDDHSGTLSPFEVCELTRLEGRVVLQTSREVGIFFALRWDNVGHSNVWGVTIGASPIPR